MKKVFQFLSYLVFIVGCSNKPIVFVTGNNSGELSSEVNCFSSNAIERDLSSSTHCDSSSFSDQNPVNQDYVNYCLDPFYISQIEDKMSMLANLKASSNEYDVFTFYTDHHCFVPNGKYEVDISLLKSHFELIKEIQDLSGSEFVMCGGDLLQNYDTKSQACFKLATYMSFMDSYLDNPYILVGNHDTNCQGQDYINFGDYLSCTLSQETINDIFYNGKNSYYNFSTINTSYYCFDSGIDWFAFDLSEYQKEQLKWFADSLLNDDFIHKAIFIHIALVRYESTRVITSMMSEIGKIVEEYNSKKAIVVNGNYYDYSSCNGEIKFIQAGHSHVDLNTICGSIPTIITSSFASPEAVSKPTLDVVFVDYANHKVHCLRIGDGDDRVFEV